MNVHFMAVPADRMIAVDIPVAVYKILHVTVVLLTTRHDITEIHCFASTSNAKNSFATSCSSTKWCRCFFPPKRERAIVRSFHDEIL